MEKGSSGYRPIEEYAVLGDCRSAALVSRDGSLDWLCLPRFDSPSVFAAILDAEAGGRFQIRPSNDYASERRYLGPTNVLETTFRTDAGSLRLVDCMTLFDDEAKSRELCPGHEIVRLLECTEGEVEVRIRYDPRPEYGRVVPRLQRREPAGIWCEHRGDALALRTEVPLESIPDRPGAVGTVRLRAGERRRLSLSYVQGQPMVITPLGETVEGRIERTLAWWSRWADRCDYQGPYRDAVVRSALTLKSMIFAPSGAVVASPTTSLPEKIGGVRNWDYRYCWLRDASLILEALLNLGYRDEGLAFHAWALHATRMTWPELNVLYDVYGRSTITETELEHLEGYRGSRPVRIGNAAENQLQLDIYGEMVDAVWRYLRRGGTLDRVTARQLVRFGETVCRRWREPDEGIWEIRGARVHHTFSKAMCWVALDRLLKLHRAGHLRVPVERFEAERREIRDRVERHGFADELGSYVTAFDGDDVDASLLLLSRYGYVDAAAPRMRSTCALIQERLGHDGMMYRYHGGEEDGLPEGEGAFGICGFWFVENLARQGALDEARSRFEHLSSYANDVGLFGEEIDPESGAALGNFPQALTHIGLINAAVCLREEGRAATVETAASDVSAVPPPSPEPPEIPSRETSA